MSVALHGAAQAIIISASFGLSITKNRPEATNAK